MFDVCVNLHSEQFSTNPWAVVERGFEAGLTGMGLTGSCLDSSRLAMQLAQQHPDKLCATVGLHPHSAKDHSPELMRTFREMAQQPIVRAIGECGLDYFRNISTPTQQRECFISFGLTRELQPYSYTNGTLTEFIDIMDSLLQCSDASALFYRWNRRIEALLERGYCWNHRMDSRHTSESRITGSHPILPQSGC